MDNFDDCLKLLTVNNELQENNTELIGNHKQLLGLYTDQGNQYRDLKINHERLKISCLYLKENNKILILKIQEYSKQLSASKGMTIKCD